ncbi:unnamed protein product [Clonostachys rosea]|uniref:Major facilitator superfamily (MFS) profile domain-containing protein n=1 Tax=Bionectria ochroleuca TaxID=29856 RepID=A0ABY6TW68_BIOOC|nr:unnamed protein product [Clonostachys rosea]
MALTTLPGASMVHKESRESWNNDTADVEKSKKEEPGSQQIVLDLHSPDVRQIVRRIDRRLVITAGCMYSVSLIDRANLGAANIAGMSADLRLDIGYRYVCIPSLLENLQCAYKGKSLIALVFFISYTLFQSPATILCRKLGPRYFLPGISLAWGGLLIGFGFPTKWEDLVVMRTLLGLLEAGFLPGCLYLISTWYTRYDLQKRLTVFYIIGFFSSGLGGILAYGLMQMNGLGGLAGWRWIFIMEGIITIFIAIVSYFTLVDFPDQAHKTSNFLTRAECETIIHLIDLGRGDASEEPWNFKKWASSGKDPIIWGYGICFFGFTAITYGVAYFLPLILRDRMGFSMAASQCLIAPPYFVASVYMYCTAWLSDKYHIRGPIIAVNTLVGVAGLCLMGLVQNSGVAYFGVFLICCGFNTNIPACMAYQSNNIRGQWKRAFCSASFIGLGGVGGVAGSLMYRSQDAPSYRLGLYLSVGFAALVLVILALNTWYFRRENAKADRGDKVLQGHPGFRYTI